MVAEQRIAPELEQTTQALAVGAKKWVSSALFPPLFCASKRTGRISKVLRWAGVNAGSLVKESVRAGGKGQRGSFGDENERAYQVKASSAVQVAASSSSHCLQIWFVSSWYDPIGHKSTQAPPERYLVELLGKGSQWGAPNRPQKRDVPGEGGSRRVALDGVAVVALLAGTGCWKERRPLAKLEGHDCVGDSLRELANELEGHFD